MLGFVDAAAQSAIPLKTVHSLCPYAIFTSAA